MLLGQLFKAIPVSENKSWSTSRVTVFHWMINELRVYTTNQVVETKGQNPHKNEISHCMLSDIKIC